MWCYIPICTMVEPDATIEFVASAGGRRSNAVRGSTYVAISPLIARSPSIRVVTKTAATPAQTAKTNITSRALLASRSSNVAAAVPNVVSLHQIAMRSIPMNIAAIMHRSTCAIGPTTPEFFNGLIEILTERGRALLRKRGSQPWRESVRQFLDITRRAHCVLAGAARPLLANTRWRHPWV
jgi:hypothetical protein